MQQKQDSAVWILRTTRRILKEVGPKAARRFLDSRGGPARWETAAREIAYHMLRKKGTGPANTRSPSLSGSSYKNGESVEVCSFNQACG